MGKCYACNSAQEGGGVQVKQCMYLAVCGGFQAHVAELINSPNLEEIVRYDQWVSVRGAFVVCELCVSLSDGGKGV